MSFSLCVLGLTIDYAMDHTLYWADSKLNTIQRINQDGTNRMTVLSGGKSNNSSFKCFGPAGIPLIFRANSSIFKFLIIFQEFIEIFGDFWR